MRRECIMLSTTSTTCWFAVAQISDSGTAVEAYRVIAWDRKGDEPVRPVTLSDEHLGPISWDLRAAQQPGCALAVGYSEAHAVRLATERAETSLRGSTPA